VNEIGIGSARRSKLRRAAPPTDPDVRNSRIRLLRSRLCCVSKARVNGDGRRQRESLEESVEPVPVHRPLLPSSPDPLEPYAGCLIKQSRQRFRVPRNTEVPIVSLELPTETRVLLLQWLVTVCATELRDAFKRSREPAARRLSLDDRIALPCLTQVVGKSKKIKATGGEGHPATTRAGNVPAASCPGGA